MKIIIFERVLTHYRLKFYNFLVDQYKADITFLTKEIPKYSGFNTDVSNAKFKIIKLKYFNFFGFELYRIPFFILNSKSTMIFVLSFRSLFNSFYMFYRKIIGKTFFWWGHSRNFSNSSFFESIKDYIKIFQIHFSDGVLAYTVGEKERFIKNGINEKKIFVLNNTIDTKTILKNLRSISNNAIQKVNHKYDLNNKFVIGFIGRLHKLRNTEYAIRAIIDLNIIHKNLFFFIIGSGEEYEYLVNKYSKYSFISFLGNIEDENVLAPFIYNIKFFINPGLIGLNIVHSMIYGKPTVAIKKKYHSPEIEFLKSGYNGILSENNFESYKKEISRLIYDSNLLLKMSQNAFDFASNELSIENMGKNFIKIIK